MKTIIIESIWVKPHLETAGEIALTQKKKNPNIYFAWVGTDLFWNEWDIPKISKFLGGDINRRINKFEKILLKRGIKTLKDNFLPNLKKIENWSENFNGDINNLKKYKYKNQPLGMGVASSLITFYNNKNPNFFLLKDKVKQLLCTSAYIYEKTHYIINKNKPDKIITFNNRFASSLPIILAAEKLNIKICRHDRGSNYKKYYIYNHDINDPKNFKNLKLLNNTNKKELKIAKDYFKKKFDGTFRDEVNKNFTNKQTQNLLPDLPKNKKIITYFTSTEYEQAAYIKLKFDQIKIFKKFYSILKNSKNIHLFIRVHPSLSSGDDKIWIPFKKNNVSVISSSSKIDTYALMRKSNLVCGYSSKIVLESAYLNIPTICFKDFGWPKRMGILYGEKKKQIKRNFNISLNNKIKFDLNKILSVSYFYSTYGVDYKYFKPQLNNRGKFLNDSLEWKSSIILLFQKLNLDKLYFLIKKIYRFFL